MASPSDRDASDDGEINDEVVKPDKSNAMSKRIAQMDDDQRRHFELFRSPHCKIPQKKVKEILQTQFPRVTVQETAALAVKLFVTEENAKGNEKGKAAAEKRDELRRFN
jgi:hypothetical protein